MHQFSLAGLPELLRVELLYALQQRDQAPPPLDPTEVRILLGRLGDAASLREADPQAVCESGGGAYNSATRGLFRDLRRHLDRAWAQHTGADPFAGDVWQVALLDLPVNASRRWPATQGVRRLPRHRTALAARGRQGLGPRHPALPAAAARDAARLPGRLPRPDRRRPGRPGQSRRRRLHPHPRRDRLPAASRRQPCIPRSHRNLMLYQFCQVIEHGRASGLMARVPDPFRPARRHRVRDEPNEDELGKALPETVIRQLDAHLHLLGPAGRAGALTADDLQLMHQTIYRILRDTGRRPGEVVSLQVDCLEVIDGQHNLIYDNHKAGRMRRRLPITTEHRRGDHRLAAATGPATHPASLRHWLFPSPLLRAQQSRGHLTSARVGRAFKAWVAQIGAIDSELLGPDGTPAPFDPSLITPYALRHSYAQRHADGGVPVDVLKELMDHAAVATTMGYYRVRLKRKQQAIRSVGSLAIDAAGNPAPFTSPTAYQRASVAVPFGNCTEPSNVKAGGGACPIRFQCAGCGFYRPDPSYLPALEQHIAALRADRETARAIGAAAYVTDNLTAEIRAFSHVAEQMHHRLAELAPDEREEVEQASKLLRRARAARQLPLIAHPAPHGDPDDHLTDRTAGLRAARAKDSHDKRRRALADHRRPASRRTPRSPRPPSPAPPACPPGCSTPTASANTSTPPADAKPPRRPTRRRRHPHRARQPVTPAGLRTDLAARPRRDPPATRRTRQTPPPATPATRSRDRRTRPRRTHRTRRRPRILNRRLLAERDARTTEADPAQRRVRRTRRRPHRRPRKPPTSNQGHQPMTRPAGQL